MVRQTWCAFVISVVLMAALAQAWTPVRFAFEFNGGCDTTDSGGLSCEYEAPSEKWLSTIDDGGTAQLQTDKLPGSGRAVLYDEITFLSGGLTFEKGNVTFVAGDEAATNVIFFEVFSGVPGVTMSSPPGELCGTAVYNITGGTGAYAGVHGGITSMGCVTPESGRKYAGTFITTGVAWLP